MAVNARSPQNRTTPYLTGLVGALTGHELILNSRRHVLGRDAGKCDLVLEHSRISREHLVIEIDADGHVTITDVGSTQGTFVNGERVTQCQLKDGDCVGLGREGMVALRFSAANRSDTIPSTPTAVSVEDVKARLRAAAETAAGSAHHHDHSKLCPQANHPKLLCQALSVSDVRQTTTSFSIHLASRATTLCLDTAMRARQALSTARAQMALS